MAPIRFKTLAEGYSAFRMNLKTCLRDPGFQFTRQAVAASPVTWIYKSVPHTFNPVMDMLVMQKRDYYSNPTHLTAQDLAQDPALLTLYIDKVSPLLISFWQDAYALHLAGQEGTLMPVGLCTPTFQGTLNFNLIGQHVVESPQYMGLAFDKATHTVPPQLRRENREQYFLSQGLIDPHKVKAKGWWTQMFQKYALLTGFQTIYEQGAYAFFSHPQNYAWAFNYSRPEEQHLHWSDFQQHGMWNDLSRTSPAWRDIDHVLRRHWGLVVYDAITNTIDPRLFPEKHPALFAELRAKLGFDFSSWYELFYHEFMGLLFSSGIDLEPGMIFKTRHPKAFAPKAARTEFLRLHWFKTKNVFKTIAEKRQALETEIIAANIPWEQVPKSCNRQWLRSVGLSMLFFEGINNFKSILDIFRELFPEKFVTSAGGIWHEDDFPHTFLASYSQPQFKKIKTQHRKQRKPYYCETGFNGIKILLPLKLAGLTIRQASNEHAIIYRKKTTIHENKRFIEWVPEKALVFGALTAGAKAHNKLSIVAPESAIVPINSGQLPNYDVFRTLEGNILDAGVNPWKLSINEQIELVAAYKKSGEKGLKKFIEQLEITKN